MGLSSLQKSVAVSTEKHSTHIQDVYNSPLHACFVWRGRRHIKLWYGAFIVDPKMRLRVRSMWNFSSTPLMFGEYLYILG